MLFVQSVYSTAGLLAEVVATMSTACFVDVLRSNFTEGGHFSCCYMYSKWKTVTSARTVPTYACVTNIEHSVLEPQCVGWVITVPPASDRHYHLWPCHARIFPSSPPPSLAGVLALSLLGVAEGEIEYIVT